MSCTGLIFVTKWHKFAPKKKEADTHTQNNICYSYVNVKK
jgi:hypothetical protein